MCRPRGFEGHSAVAAVSQGSSAAPRKQACVPEVRSWRQAMSGCGVEGEGRLGARVRLCVTRREIGCGEAWYWARFRAITNRGSRRAREWHHEPQDRAGPSMCREEIPSALEPAFDIPLSSSGETWAKRDWETPHWGIQCAYPMANLGLKWRKGVSGRTGKARRPGSGVPPWHGAGFRAVRLSRLNTGRSRQDIPGGSRGVRPSFPSCPFPSFVRSPPS